MGWHLEWIIERRDDAGRWHLVHSSTRHHTLRHRPETERTLPEATIGAQSYPRFGKMIDLFGDRADLFPPLAAPLLTRGGPADASAGTRDERASWGANPPADGLVWGHADGTVLAAWQHSRDKHLAPFAKAVMDVLRSGRASTPLAIRIGRPTAIRATYEDLAGVESAHACARRQRTATALRDWQHDPSSWRLITLFVF